MQSTMEVPDWGRADVGFLGAFVEFLRGIERLNLSEERIQTEVRYALHTACVFASKLQVRLTCGNEVKGGKMYNGC